MSHKKHILFVTTANLTSNPRLLKEIQTAYNTFDITVVCFSMGNWTDNNDLQLQKQLSGVQFVYLSATRSPFLWWLISSIVERLCIKLYRFFPKNVLVNAYASNKRSWLLQYFLPKVVGLFDLIVAHNLGALYPAYLLAKQKAISFAFDVEDYHPGERITADATNERARRLFLMRRFLPNAMYVSFASPLIAKEVEKEVPTIQKSMVINNSFWSHEFSLAQPRQTDNRVRLVWFSQYIDFYRGLELIVPLVQHFEGKIQLTLIGTLASRFEKYLQQYQYIEVLPPMNQSVLHRNLSSYDVGLALEQADADENKDVCTPNRDICLTNKIFAYIQAGLFILATDTTAQQAFLEQMPNIGVVANKGTINKQLQYLVENTEKIRNEKINRFAYAQVLSWDVEKDKLLRLWQK